MADCAPDAGDEWRDVTEVVIIFAGLHTILYGQQIFRGAASELGLGEMIHGDSFTLYGSMSAVSVHILMKFIN